MISQGRFLKYSLPLIVVVILLFSTEFQAFQSKWFHSNWDAKNYFQLAINFREKQSVWEATSSIPSHHAYRWVPIWFVSILPLDIDIAFFLISTIITAVLAFAIYSLLKLRLSEWSHRICFLSVGFYAYYLRFYLFDPYQVGDVLFALSIPLFLIGVENGKTSTILLASFLGIIGRQTALVYIPLLIYLGMISRLLWKSLIYIISITIITFILVSVPLNQWFQTLLLHVSPQSGYSNFSVEWIYLLAMMFGPLLPTVVFLAFIQGREFLKLFKEDGHLLFLVGLISIQPILGGPDQTGENVMRLTAFALPSLALFVGIFLDRVTMISWFSGLFLIMAILLEAFFVGAYVRQIPVLNDIFLKIRPFYAMHGLFLSGILLALFMKRREGIGQSRSNAAVG